MRRRIEMSGHRYGHWTVLGKSKRLHYWICRCDCGTTKEVLGRTLRYGTSTNCGCEKARTTGQRSRKHGMSSASLYFAWNNMKGRCTRPARVDYAQYGGQGINFCNDWADFLSFKLWAEDNGYREGMTLERLDQAKDYTPDNCRWRLRGRAGHESKKATSANGG